MAAPAKAGMRGHPPTAKIQEYKVSGADVKKIVGNPERFKYEKAWKVDAYRNVAPGERLVESFLEAASPKEGSTIVDWGCGTGRAGYALYQKGYDVTLVDFAGNCLDENVREACKDNDRLRFVEADLSGKVDVTGEYGFCTDVLEHIPPGQVDAVLDNILYNTKYVFLQISTVQDGFGGHPDIGERLHLTVQDYHWWLEKLISKKVVLYRSNDSQNSCVFYVTGWGPYKGRVNLDHDLIVKNIVENSKLGLKQVIPHEENDTEILLLAGGPSLNDFEAEIIERSKDTKVVTVNGTYKWATERGISPVNQIMIDAREHNFRFVETVDEKNLYFIASQCDPKVFENLPKDRTLIWHVSIDEATIPIIKEHYGKMYEDWYPCPGGSTVTTRALCLLMMLGFRKFTIYGFDSCFRQGEHHAYPQPENDKQNVVNQVVLRGTKHEKTFKCAPWHVFQAQDFFDMVPRNLKYAQLDVKGDGLIAHTLRGVADLDNIVAEQIA